MTCSRAGAYCPPIYWHDNEGYGFLIPAQYEGLSCNMQHIVTSYVKFENEKELLRWGGLLRLNENVYDWRERITEVEGMNYRHLRGQGISINSVQFLQHSVGPPLCSVLYISEWFFNGLIYCEIYNTINPPLITLVLGGIQSD